MMISAKNLKYEIEINLDIPIMYDAENCSVKCVNCGLDIGHPSIFFETNYECPKCGFEYKKKRPGVI